MVATLSRSQVMSVFNADEPAPGVDPQFSCFLEDARAAAVHAQMTRVLDIPSHSNMSPQPLFEGASTSPRARISGEPGTQWRGSATTWEAGVKQQQEWQLDNHVPFTQAVIVQDVRCIRATACEGAEVGRPLYRDDEATFDVVTFFVEPNPKARLVGS